MISVFHTTDPVQETWQQHHPQQPQVCPVNSLARCGVRGKAVVSRLFASALPDRLIPPLLLAMLCWGALSTENTWGESEKPAARPPRALPALELVEFVSSADGTTQPLLTWAPESARSEAAPLLIYLHSWSGNYKQNNTRWHAEAVRRGWIFLHPDFRGVNDHPEACGSPLARQDILDSLDYALQKYQVDRSRIYLAGSSGGGHMALLMAGHHPERFSAVSAWVPITDLAAWHALHSRGEKQGRYAVMIEKSLGGPPGLSAAVDAAYQDRSPVQHLHRAAGLPVHIHAGIHDGHSGSVPIDHSLRAFNVLAEANQGPLVPEATIEHLLKQGRKGYSKSSDQAAPLDSETGQEREIRFRQEAGPAVVTIFEGGHEGLPLTACEWLSRQQRPVPQPQPESP